MIKKIRIQNFQSHKDSTIEFSDKDTVIVGSSDSGKSAVLRALEFVRANRPLGTSFIRTGANAPCRVELTVSKNGQDIVIVHQKTTKANTYTVNGEEYTAIGSDVPDSVKELLNLTDINVQKQLDQHFLVLDSPGKVAGYINSITKLEDADMVQTILNRRIRESNQKQEDIKNEIRDVQEKQKESQFQILPEFKQVLDLLIETDSYYDCSCKSRISLSQIIHSVVQTENSLALVEKELKDKKVVEDLIQCLGELERSSSEVIKTHSVLKSVADQAEGLDLALTDLYYSVETTRHECTLLEDLVSIASKLSDCAGFRGAIGTIAGNVESILRKEEEVSKQIAIDTEFVSTTESRIKAVANAPSLIPLSESLRRIITSVEDVDLNLARNQNLELESKMNIQSILSAIDVCPTCGSELDDVKRQLVIESIA